jgi:hypothetical protein
LDEIGIAYAIVGGMALFEYGLRRFTEDVDLLVTREGLKAIHNSLIGLGYVQPFAGSKNLRDAENGVRIEFLIAGQFPGDGKPKPVAFPDPAQASRVSHGRRYIEMTDLVELKLASGMSNPDRQKDLADVQELIKTLSLPLDFAEKLNPYVQAKYIEIWNTSRVAVRRYVRIWRHTRLPSKAQTLEELIDGFPEESEVLRAVRDAGVTLDAGRGGLGDAYLVTSDPAIAKKFDMHDESEFISEGE